MTNATAMKRPVPLFQFGLWFALLGVLLGVLIGTALTLRLGQDAAVVIGIAAGLTSLAIGKFASSRQVSILPAATRQDAATRIIHAASAEESKRIAGWLEYQASLDEREGAKEVAESLRQRAAVVREGAAKHLAKAYPPKKEQP